MPRPRPARRPRPPSLRQRLLAPLGRLAALLPGRKAAPRRPRKAAKPSPRALLLPGGGRKRSLQEWKEQRRRTAAEVKAHLAEEQPLVAIRKLTRALLEDPQHPPYHELLKKAAEQRRQRRLKAGRKDPWAELPRELRQDALQLEAFTAYVEELEQLFDKAGIPPLSAPPPPGTRQQAKAAADSKATTEEGGGRKRSRGAAKPGRKTGRKAEPAGGKAAARGRITGGETSP